MQRKLTSTAIATGLALTLALFSVSTAKAGAEVWVAEGFVPYFNYTGELRVSGEVTVSREDETQAVRYALAGVDPACQNGAGDAGNSCGIHVHAEPTCAGDAGGHYFAGAVTEDPWKNIGYTAQGEGNGMASGGISVTTGAAAAELEGRSIVIHDLTGARVACALLKNNADGADPMPVIED